MMHDVRPTVGDSEWFVKARFGMFIHWGLYAMAARHEWVKHFEQLTDERYDLYFRNFDPDLYDPHAWARAAAGAGMKYMVVTSKHHEGFCLWDSMLTDYKAPNTPARRDLLRPMLDAYRAEGLRAGLYHSVIDWHHPHYVLDRRRTPQRDRPDFDELNRGRDQRKYIEYLHGQVRELLTQYGPIDVMWFDFTFTEHGDPDDLTQCKGRKAFDSERLLKMVRELQPTILVNDRLDLRDVQGGWDILTPKQAQPAAWPTVDGRKVVWEACQTFSGSWGYHRDEQNWRSVHELVFILIDCVSKGGNLLLNVGPTGRGTFDERALARLRGIGEWMRLHGKSIYGCTQAPDEFAAPLDTRLTFNPETNRLYIHLLNYPYKDLILNGKAYAERFEYAQLLNDGSEVQAIGHDPLQRKGQPPEQLILRLPPARPEVEVPVVEVMLKNSRG